MEIVVGIIVYILLTIFFWLIIQRALEMEAQGKITVIRNKFDWFFNIIVYILPSIIFLLDIPNIEPLKFYIITCLGFTFIMCMSVCDTNNTIETKIGASIIKIIIGIESIFVIIGFLIILLLLIVGSDKNKRSRT